jgi:hypothetical protein
VRTGLITRLVLSKQITVNHFKICISSTQSKDLNQNLISDIQQVPKTAEYIVVSHEPFPAGKLWSCRVLPFCLQNAK